MANDTCHIQMQDTIGKYSELDYTHCRESILPLKVDISNWIRRICDESPEGYFQTKLQRKLHNPSSPNLKIIRLVWS